MEKNLNYKGPDTPVPAFYFLSLTHFLPLTQSVFFKKVKKEYTVNEEAAVSAKLTDLAFFPLPVDRVEIFSIDQKRFIRRTAAHGNVDREEQTVKQ